MTNELPRMRTIPKAYEQLKKIDPESCITMRSLRKMVKCGDIPTVKIGNKTLINYDLFCQALSCYNNDGRVLHS